ncbi:hypothetical protein Q6A49_00230 [Pseudomonas sp. 22-AL-CL-001]|uniref:hypothetical protein n=1 Tax=Pseudomonas alabamensis TaxID=3064349 RepID=UPI002713853F|nr:hypothetical protein [Pseudomonas sp. 22-AL-CL-001]MDO7908973.1 hypothetical protein [Pseudomonas sp. 22-AL-CL-001]
MSQARRRLRRIAELVGKGHVFIVTKNGKPSVMIDAPEPLEERERKPGRPLTR